MIIKVDEYNKQEFDVVETIMTIKKIGTVQMSNGKHKGFFETTFHVANETRFCDNGFDTEIEFDNKEDTMAQLRNAYTVGKNITGFYFDKDVMYIDSVAYNKCVLDYDRVSYPTGIVVAFGIFVLVFILSTLAVYFFVKPKPPKPVRNGVEIELQHI